MRTIHRDIVGGFIFSKDGKLLLGKNHKGGVYEGQFVVPAGGVEEGETKEQALVRELREETGIDITNAKISEMPSAKGEHEKTLEGTGERVFVKMTFYDYRVDLNENYNEVVLRPGSDWCEPTWFDLKDINEKNVCEPTLKELLVTGILNK